MNKISIFLLLLFPFATFGQESMGKKGHQLFQDRKYKESIQVFSDLIELNEKSNQTYYAYHYRGYSHYLLGNTMKAIDDLETALELDKSDKFYRQIVADSHSLLNRIWERFGEIDKALEHLLFAIEIAPDDSHLWNNLALMQFDLSHYEEALESIDKALELNKQDAYAWSNKSKVHLKLGNTEEAFTAAEKAIEMRPDNPYAFKHRAMAYIENGQFKKACLDLKKANELNYSEFGGKLEEIDSKEVDLLLLQIDCGI